MRTLPVALLLAFAAIQSSSSASDAGTRKGTVCWPLNFAGITVDVNTDSPVQRLLGKSVFDEGHTGGRYFVDASNTATLHIVEGVDQVVEELTVTEGVTREIKSSDRAVATSKWFDPHEPLEIITLCIWVLPMKRSSLISENRKRESTLAGGSTSLPVRAKYLLI